LAGGILYGVGLIGWALRAVGLVIRIAVREGFRLWERLLAWATWPLFLAIVFGFIFVGGVLGGWSPGLRILCALAVMAMGGCACLAYMFIDLERYEVERGYKAIHNPLMGQLLAIHLARYGQRVTVPLLISASVAMIGGFALLNQGLYESIGRNWYEAAGGRQEPIYVDFVAYALTNLLGLVDVLNLANSRHWLRAAYVHQAAWPASAMLAGFRVFFSVVLLQQLFASLRQGKLLAETIADFWSPHQPIHERARNALPQYGPLAIGPLLLSLRSVSSLTKEQRDQLPLIIATIGPSTIPALVRHLHDSHEHVRGIAAESLGHLHALETVPLLTSLAQDSSEVVRQCVVAALGLLCGECAGLARKEVGKKPARSRRLRERAILLLFRGRNRHALVPPPDPFELSMSILESALTDESVTVRIVAARSLGQIGPRAVKSVSGLIGLLKDADETVRCQAAESLGQVKSENEATVAALTELLQDASAPVKAAAARALGALKKAAAAAVPLLVPLLQDRDEGVRNAAAEAIAQVGALNEAATDSLAEGLSSPDSSVRAQTAEAIGTIGAAAEDVAPALVEAMTDNNDRVRATAVEALGKIGESAAAASVPGLVRALRDRDNWVSALAAEALGQMGDSADGAVPALIRALGHLNAQVRGNAAEALGNLGTTSARARTALEKASRDEDGGVRAQAIRALGAVGRPTASSTQLVLEAIQDDDPLVRVAAVAAVGELGESSETIASGLLTLLDDANDQVKVETTRVLPKLAGPSRAVIEGLCRRLVEDDSSWVQVHAALALGKLGSSASAAGEDLLRAAKTGDLSVREEAMRAIAKIQPPQATEAFIAGLVDACNDIRIVASAGWMKAPEIPEEAISALVDALRDPEPQVRANVAHALARLDPLPTDAIPLLIECADHVHDGLRINAAMALKLAPANDVNDLMENLVSDSSARVRLIAAGFLLSTGSDNSKARSVLVEALDDSAPLVRGAALQLVESLGTDGSTFLEELRNRDRLERNAELRVALTRLIDRIGDAGKDSGAPSEEPDEMVAPPLFT
jgi:HEAT repeat protein